MYWNTVSEQLKACLLKLMEADCLKEFRLVGGTALSLQWGHRMSVDIDLFTDANYGSIDFNIIEAFLKNSFKYTVGDFGNNPAMGKSYLLGDEPDSLIKVDIFYSMDPFFQPVIEEDGARIATAEEIIAMKIDIIQRGARKKDWWDIHEGLNHYNIPQMIALHKSRFEWTHDDVIIRKNFTDFKEADEDFDPICLRGKYWAFIKADIEEAFDESDIK